MALSKVCFNYSNNGIVTNNTLSIYSFNSPVGKLIAAADENFLYNVTFEDSKNFEKIIQALCKNLSCGLVEKQNKILKQLEQELTEYFEGNLKKFTVPIKTIGSDFQKNVWDKLQELPYASTQTYGDLAKTLGRPASHARAVGAACGANSHLLIIPCHRVVATGSRGGFSCGIDRKDWLIEHEKKHDQT